MVPVMVPVMVMGTFVGLVGESVHDALAGGPAGAAESTTLSAALGDVHDARGGPDDLLGLVDKVGVDRVHQPSIDLKAGVPQDEQDGDGDEQSDDRVGEREAEPGAGAADPVRRPVRTPYWATSSLPRDPTTPAAARTPTWLSSRGFWKRWIAS
jgi:hypothetical protein